MSRPPVRGIFLSYRRSDAAATAGRINDHLTEAFPGIPIFMDVGSIEAGEDFEKAITEAIDASSHLLAIIGSGPNMTRNLARLGDEGDYVRLEIARALESDKRVVPVLVEDAQMPGDAQLPADLQAFARCNAVPVRHARFDDDVDNLIDALRGDTRQRRHRRPGWKKLLLGAVAGAVVFALLGLIVQVVQFEVSGRSLAYLIGNVGAALYLPAFAIAGAALGVRRVLQR